MWRGSWRIDVSKQLGSLKMGKHRFQAAFYVARGVFNPPANPILAFPRQREKEQMTEFLIYAPCCQQRVG